MTNKLIQLIMIKLSSGHNWLKMMKMKDVMQTERRLQTKQLRIFNLHNIARSNHRGSEVLYYLSE